MTSSNDSAKRILLDKIMNGSVPLREIENGRLLNLLAIAIKQGAPAHSGRRIEPPTYGFDSSEAFLATAIQFLPPSDRWALAILISELMAYVWRKTRGEGPASDWNSVFAHLGTMPIVIPHPEIQDRLGVMADRIVCETGYAPLLLELKSDLEERVYSIYRLDCEEIELVEREFYET